MNLPASMTPADVPVAAPVPATAGRARWRAVPIRGYAGIAVFLLMVAISVAAPWLRPHDPNATDVLHALAAPSAAHPFGTDGVGHDVLTRTLYAGRPTLLLSVTITLCAAFIGVPFGLLAGYRGGWLDTTVMRMCDVIFALPPIVLALAILGVLGAGTGNLIIALTVVYAPMLARTTRSLTLSVTTRQFVTAARCVGDTPARIVVRQVVPNIAGAVAVQALLVLSYALLYEASLSFLGLGTTPSDPSWGRLLTDAISLTTVAPWAGLFPGLFIVITVVALNITGDAFAQLTDPRARSRK